MQQFVAGDMQGTFANFTEQLSPLLAADPGPAVLGWMGVALMLLVYALFFAPAGRTARDVSAARPLRGGAAGLNTRRA